MPSSTGDPWLDWLRELLCKIYKEWGGDCDVDFPQAASGWVTKVAAAYSQNGAPTFTDPLKKQQFLDLLDALEAHLKLPGNSLSSSDTNTLIAMIAGLRSDLGTP